MKLVFDNDVDHYSGHIKDHYSAYIYDVTYIHTPLNGLVLIEVTGERYYVMDFNNQNLHEHGYLDPVEYIKLYENCPKGLVVLTNLLTDVRTSTFYDKNVQPIPNQFYLFACRKDLETHLLDQEEKKIWERFL